MKKEKMFYRLFRLNSLLIIFGFLLLSFQLKAQSNGTICDDTRQYYTNFPGDIDTIVFITSDYLNEILEKARGLYAMSEAVNGNEIGCRAVSFDFILMRGSQILYSSHYDTITSNTLKILKSEIQEFNISQGDILIFTNIVVRHS